MPRGKNKRERRARYQRDWADQYQPRGRSRQWTRSRSRSPRRRNQSVSPYKRSPSTPRRQRDSNTPSRRGRSPSRRRLESEHSKDELQHSPRRHIRQRSVIDANNTDRHDNSQENQLTQRHRGPEQQAPHHHDKPQENQLIQHRGRTEQPAPVHDTRQPSISDVNNMGRHVHYQQNPSIQYRGVSEQYLPQQYGVQGRLVQDNYGGYYANHVPNQSLLHQQPAVPAQIHGHQPRFGQDDGGNLQEGGFQHNQPRAVDDMRLRAQNFLRNLPAENNQALLPRPVGYYPVNQPPQSQAALLNNPQHRGRSPYMNEGEVLHERFTDRSGSQERVYDSWRMGVQKFERVRTRKL
ncbi:hypothetical protein F5Y16DRAFT_401436 [Xylariaceae sp. FL0255]|nr:hypothetical protein F5Y16DRAFT_401436 [Xylariaceae sp. FL0255]